MAFYRTDDPLADFDRYEAECEREREEIRAMLPVCAECGKTIEEDIAFRRHDEWLCAECVDSCMRWVWPE